MRSFSLSRSGQKISGHIKGEGLQFSGGANSWPDICRLEAPGRGDAWQRVSGVVGKPWESDVSMKVTESGSLASLSNDGAPPARPSARPQPDTGTAPQTELSLTPASRTLFTGRSERIAELRNLVSSGAYIPQANRVAVRMVDEGFVTAGLKDWCVPSNRYMEVSSVFGKNANP
jgi:hypothetical protein